MYLAIPEDSDQESAVVELSFISSIEIRAAKVLDCRGMDGTTLLEDEPICENQNRVHELFNGNPQVENVSGNMNYLFRTPEEYLQLEVTDTSVDDELEEQPLQIIGKNLKPIILSQVIKIMYF